ncbi:MAG: ATPases with chaperone activity, ATP-binding subunit [uncultured Rubrobacteraceae bacterium]|uniref:ATPases with chaperone activity, ATP-binding subunit n=1 Tax=uncultured Rubrobacteraceae bacterium TaxID=349277 RepID=A0A6J4QL49_9ACTN|nr:MAG: ATPases with chaperone activity, ATP-binding subunit [uncultured Rubrobacteraceae bacterium]
MSSTIETLERELGEAQLIRADQQKAVIRAENAHEAACAARDDAWTESEGFATDDEVERLSTLVYERRRQLYEAIDRLKAAEGKERRIKSRLMYVLPAERRRYLSGAVDGEFEEFLRAVEAAYYDGRSPGIEVSVVTEKPGELDLRGDATWRALERLYSGTVRRWVEIRAGRSPGAAEKAGAMARQVAYYAGGHVPRVFVGGEEIQTDGPSTGGRTGPEGWRPLAGFDGPKGRLALARITARRYLDEGSVARLSKRAASLGQIAEIARLYQTMNLTGDEIRWRLEQLISLRLEVLEAVYDLTGDRRRFSFYEVARAARLLDGHFPDSGVAAEALLRAVKRAVETGVPLVDVAYLSVTSGEGF